MDKVQYEKFRHIHRYIDTCAKFASYKFITIFRHFFVLKLVLSPALDKIRDLQNSRPWD